MNGGMRDWVLGAPGRIVTWPAPDAYVLVDGVLLRMRPDRPGTAPGTEVVVGLAPDGRTLLARTTPPGSADGTEHPANEDGHSTHEDGHSTHKDRHSMHEDGHTTDE
ncbi:hypothetical protein ABZX40_07625 [Streptomyces sp. NPDC004610]|uniref:hypothetical protein n=1 Tax=unclassified Streptomyces TaxID=2593676 RepID=UPI0033A38755